MRLFVAGEEIKAKIFRKDKLINKYRRYGQKEHASKYYKNKLIYDLCAEKNEIFYYTCGDCNIRETRSYNYY